MLDWNWDQTGVFSKLILNRSEGVLDLQVLRYLGFVHLVTESGIHLYALFGITLAFWKWVARSSRLNVRQAWIAGCVSGLGLCVIAWSISDWRVGLFRPLVSVSVRVFSQALGFRFAWWGPLVAALGIDLLVFGEASAPGRLHYVLAVCGGLWVWNKVRDSQLSHLKMAIVSWFATALFDVWELGLISTFTPIWSLITIPVFAVIVFPLVLLAQIGVWNSPYVFEWINELMVKCVEIAFALPGIVVVSKNMLVVSVLLGFVAVFVKLKWRIAMMAAVVIISALIPPAESQFIQKDVGQGDAFVWKHSGLVTMIDTGDTHRLKDSQWLKFFFQHQITEIDQIVFTHMDSDHASGVKRLERLIPIRECSVSEAHLVSRKSPCVYVPTTQPLDSPEMKISTIGRGGKKGNRVMTGVWIKDVRVGEYLNLGDAEMRLELKIYYELKKKWKEGDSVIKSIAQQKIFPSTRTLKATHHGSRYSTSEEFLKDYQPDEVWISSGARNRYGHPSERALELFFKQGVQVRRTDTSGDLVR
ncbi:MAG: MBL fold metallo-hydrolase [Xanthomonadaceae bacterium]|nr:MBL fold metallo-hydrolase [Xanthomonadaceae bacterium]